MNNPSFISYQKIWLMSYPLMISLIIEHMIGLTDAIFLGRVGDVALGACALGGVYYMAMFMLAFGFGFGAQIIIARRNGERRYNRIGPTMIQGCYFMLVLAVVLFTAAQYFFPHHPAGYHRVPAGLRRHGGLPALAHLRHLSPSSA